MEERSVHPLDYVAVLRRRKWWLIAPFVVCIIGGAALLMFLPREYKSQAEIGIADPTLSPELLKGMQSLDMRERQRAISQQLLSRTVLERVVREERISPNREVEDTAARLRARVEENIEVPNPIGRSGPKEGIESFRLGYVDSSPERAQRIANRLATVFVEENSKTKTQRAENTSEVLGQQLRDSQEKLNRIAEQLRSKKELYMGRLPAQANANVAMLNGRVQQLESISMSLRGDTERLSQVESTLQMMEQGIGTSGGAQAIMASQSRLNTLQQELTQARALGYTDIHPEIIRIKGEIAEADKDLTSARKQSPDNRQELLKVDPIYRAKKEERDALEIRIKQLRTAEAQARAQIAAYQTKVDTAPMVEQDLSPLEQEQELEKARFNSLTAKHQDALLNEDITRKQGGERFVILMPAFLPTKASSPNFLKVMAMAIALGFVLGCAAVVGREFMDRSVHDARALQSEFAVPVLGEIPRIHGVA
jgi:polysaccharide chain length determinant protein (PEP-CTERM system associated)